MDTELLAVSKIANMVGRCALLKAYITTNDKTPLTDGYIDVFDGPKQSNRERRGRINVQVKGRNRPLAKSNPSYSVSRIDLLNYQRDGGVLYFVVTINPQSTSASPYYALLSPFVISGLLETSASDDGTIAVSMAKFPNEPNAIQAIVQLALTTKAQDPDLGFDDALIAQVRGFTVHALRELDFDEPLVVSSGSMEYALVAHTSGGMSIPMNGELQILPAEYVPERNEIETRTGVVSYSAAVVRRVDTQTVEMRLSEGLAIEFVATESSQSANITFTLESTLAGRLKSLEFFLSLFDTQSLELDGITSTFEISSPTDVAELRTHLNTLRSLDELLSVLNIDTSLFNLDEADQTQHRQLNVMHRAFVRGEEIYDPTVELSRVLQQMGRWSIMFMIIPGSSSDHWSFLNPFEPATRRQFRWRGEDGRDEYIQVTAYDIVEPEHLPTVLNLSLDSIVEAYEEISELPTTNNIANQRVLALITAADADGPQQMALLRAAGELNAWLIGREGPEPRHLINGWQIDARMGSLDASQRSAVRAFRRTLPAREDIDTDLFELACALLLDDAEEVADLIGQLDAEKLELFKTWPIWALHDPSSIPTTPELT